MIKELKYSIKVAHLKFLGGKARSAFFNAARSPEWLDKQELQKLQAKYPVRPPRENYFIVPNYDNANKVLNAIGPTEDKLHFLELGCQHGMQSYPLRLKGHETTGIDIDPENFSGMAREAGVQFYHMDAEDLKFADNSFDCVFSFNAFEHMNNPEKAFQEAIRVIKPGGYIYLNFNPLYMSPWGLHSWEELAIPYCQMLFSPDMIRSVVTAQHLWYCNGWSCQAYRDLWQKYSNQVSILKYKEGINPFHLDIVAEYPSCFRSKTDCFDDLVVDGIEVLFKKTNQN